MVTLPYNPVAVVPRIVGGLLSGLIFKSSKDRRWESHLAAPLTSAEPARRGTMVMPPLHSSGVGNSAF